MGRPSFSSQADRKERGRKEKRKEKGGRGGSREEKKVRPALARVPSSVSVSGTTKYWAKKKEKQ